MHFSIPDTQEIKEDNGQSFVVYNIHMNGSFHCSLRYKQLHNLHEQLKKHYDNVNLPSFPSKKFLPLTPMQLEERRVQLEKFIQIVSQENRIMSENLVRGFLINAQMETQNLENKEVTLDIYLMNGHKISLSVFSTAHTDSVLQEVAQKINLPKELAFHFALFAVKKEDGGGMCVVRKLQEFESPYMALHSLDQGHRLVLRKGYWDSGYDVDLLEDRVALNLLYVQTVSDVERGWVVTTKDTQRQLTTLQVKGSKKEFLQLAKTLKFYGYLKFQPCISDYPEPKTEVTISAGNRELNFNFKLQGGVKEGIFKVTRMRVWRITTSITENPEVELPSGESCRLELSFEYLISKDKLQWITVISPQAILMSICLQGMVEELLMKKDGKSSRYCRPRSEGINRVGNWSYMKRDGSTQLITSICGNNNSTKSELLSYPSQTDNGKSSKKISDAIKSSVRVGTSGDSSSKDLIENSAFEGIGDDDL
ncbi:SNX17 (predicted) [Pycnogonum litorale]